MPSDEAGAVGSTRELRVELAATCRTCGKLHASDTERQAAHAALASDIWGSDGE